MNEPIEVPARLPFLELICWDTRDVHQLTLLEILNSYERGWDYRFLVSYIEHQELDFIKQLAGYYGSWLLAEEDLY